MTQKNEAEKIFNFGEKKKEKAKDKDGTWKEFEVWQSPKYIQSKKKAIELIEKGNYGLDEADFWILMNRGGEKMVYSGLIISHDGCLKINDQLEEKLKFEPESAAIYKDEGGKNVVMSYKNSAQGIYEFGEISASNCKNEYPYAMVLKRLFDRVVLRTSKIGFFGIYSVSESDSFAQKEAANDTECSKAPEPKKNAFGLSPNGALANGDDMKETQAKAAQLFFSKMKKDIEECGNLAEMEALVEKEKARVNKLQKYHLNLYEILVETTDMMKHSFAGEE